MDETKSCFFEIKKIDKPLARFIKKKKGRWPKSIKSEMKKKLQLTAQKYKEL